MTGYFECHGTGTSIGDPLEVHAVAEAMTKNRKMGDKLMIGAVRLATVTKTDWSRRTLLIVAGENQYWT